MFGNLRNPASAYAQVGVETGIETADPHKLIMMLFDGAMAAISTAALAMKSKDAKDIAVKGQSISKAIDIIINGLKLSLNMEVGGELAERLSALYEYMASRLVWANLKNDPVVLEEVRGLLGEIRDAWQQISPDQQGAGGTGQPPLA